MAKFKVWDPKNESLCATTVEHEADDRNDAAEKYAAEDVDGAADAIYSNGYDLMTMDEHGVAMLVTVTVEYEPSYYAHENSLPDGYSIHVFTMPADDENDEREMYQWEHVSGEVSGHLEGDKFVRDSFGSWDDAVADIREQQGLTD
jgi:hypothetical protein